MMTSRATTLYNYGTVNKTKQEEERKRIIEFVLRHMIHIRNYDKNIFLIQLLYILYNTMDKIIIAWSMGDSIIVA